MTKNVCSTKSNIITSNEYIKYSIYWLNWLGIYKVILATHRGGKQYMMYNEDEIDKFSTGVVANKMPVFYGRSR